MHGCIPSTSLHSTMYLLNHSILICILLYVIALHSTMYLLNRSLDAADSVDLNALHSTMYLLNPVLFNLSNYSTSKLCFVHLLINKFSRPLLVCENHGKSCRSACSSGFVDWLRFLHYQESTKVNGQIKKLVLSSLMPQNSLSSHLSCRLLNSIIESSEVSTCGFSSCLSFSSCTFDSSPSKTEFWICVKYFLHILNMRDHLFCPLSVLLISYTSTIYIFHHHILNPSYSFSPIRCFISL